MSLTTNTMLAPDAADAYHPIIAGATEHQRLSVLLLSLLGWAAVTASAILDGVADHWDSSELAEDFRPSWKHSRADAVVAGFLASLAAGLSLHAHSPACGLVAALPLALACTAKRFMLEPPQGQSSYAAWSVTLAAVGAWAAALACVAQHRWSGGLRRKLTLSPLVATSSSSSPFEPLAALQPRAKLEGEKPRPHASARRLLALAAPERWLLAVGAVALFGAAASQMAMPALIGVMMEAVATPHNCSSTSSSLLNSNATLQDAQAACAYAALGRAALLLAGVFTAGGAFTFLRGYIFTFCGERLVARLRSRLFSHLLSLDIAFFDCNKTGELINRLASDTTVIQSAATVNVSPEGANPQTFRPTVGDPTASSSTSNPKVWALASLWRQISMGLRFATQAVIGLAVIFLYTWKLSLVMLSVVPAVALFAVVYARFIKRLSKEYQSALAEGSEVAQETRGGEASTLTLTLTLGEAPTQPAASKAGAPPPPPIWSQAAER